MPVLGTPPTTTPSRVCTQVYGMPRGMSCVAGNAMWPPPGGFEPFTINPGRMLNANMLCTHLVICVLNEYVQVTWEGRLVKIYFVNYIFFWVKSVILRALSAVSCGLGRRGLKSQVEVPSRKCSPGSWWAPYVWAGPKTRIAWAIA